MSEIPAVNTTAAAHTTFKVVWAPFCPAQFEKLKKTTMKNIQILPAVLFVFAVMLSAGEPKKSNASDQRAKVNVCGLLTSSDVQAVQGEPVQETKPTSQPASGMVLTQCLFSTTTPVKSVTLTLALTTPGKPAGVRQFWQQQFHGSKPEEAQRPSEQDKKGESEQEEGLSKPRSIKGIGDEAYWVGNRLTGALYVLRGNSFLRISVGGVREESARVEKSKALAQAALKNLQNTPEAVQSSRK